MKRAADKTDTIRALLIVALQDLHDAERAWTERGPQFRTVAGSALCSFVDDDLTRSASQAAALREMLYALSASINGDTNIWLRAILDDAERDSQSIVQGPLLDTALIGAFRKGKQAERVSYETAVALADNLNLVDATRQLTDFCAQESAADEELARLLAATVGSLADA